MNRLNETRSGRSVGYIRVPVGASAASSSATQARSIERYAAEYGYDLVGLFRDEDVGTAGDRAGLEALMTFLDHPDGAVAALFVESNCRLARSATHLVRISTALRLRAVRIVEVGEDWDFDTVYRTSAMPGRLQ